MNRLRLDLLRRANGLVLRQFLNNEAAPSLREPPARQVTSTQFQRPQYPRFEDPAEAIRHITMNPVNIVNINMEHNELGYIYKYLRVKLKERYDPAAFGNSSSWPAQFQTLLQVLSANTNHATVSQTIYNIKGKLHLLNLDQIGMLLDMLRAHRHNESVKQFFRVVDTRLSWMLKEDGLMLSQDLDSWLNLVDLLYECRIKSSTNETLLRRISRDLNESDISDRQMLHLLFLIILERNDNYLFGRYEKRIFNMLDNATIEDITIICLAYFKTRTIIKSNSLLDKIINRTTENLPSVDPSQPAFCSIVKSVRYSRGANNREAVVKLINTLLEDPDHKIICSSAYNAVHTVKLMEAFRIHEPSLLHILRCLIFRNFGDFRIKDIQYALTSLSNLTYMDLEPEANLCRDFDRLVDHITGETRRDMEFQNYHLVPIIRALGMFGYHSPKLMSYIIDVLSNPAQVAQMKNVLEFDKSLLLVHAVNSIEHGDTSLLQVKPTLDICSSTISRGGNIGPIGRDSSLRQLGHILNNRDLARRQPHSARFRAIAESLADHELLKDEPFQFNFQFTFCHQNYGDLVITNNSQEPGSFDPETLLPRPISAQMRPCLVFATHKTDFIDEHGSLCGYKRLLIRLMSQLGYSVLPVDMYNCDINDLARRVKSTLHT